jgi:alkanesulfonate monooxygenase SsuD/methylene tetrahydromethanopterin reductase-like flavin-dependent oxidoreductase (luciferase family)
MVSNVATWHPAMLAKLAATVDSISGGRVDVGVGAGGGDGLYRLEYDWLGIPPLSRAGRVSRLRESVEVTTGLFRDQRLTYHGTYYHLEDAPLVPPLVQQPRPPLYIAAQGKKAMRVAAEYTDGWISLADAASASTESAQRALRERNRVLDDYCGAIGRDPGTLVRVYFAGWASWEVLFASADAFRNFVGAYQDAGVQRFIFSFVSERRTRPSLGGGRSARRQSLADFAGEVMAEMRMRAESGGALE